MMLSLAQLGNIGSVIGGLFVFMTMLFTARFGRVVQIVVCGAIILLGWQIARATGYFIGPVLNPAIAQSRGDWVIWLMQPSGVDLFIYAFFAVSAVSVTVIATRARAQQDE